jgi:5-methylcytosine-specific restriction protein A
LNYSQNKTLAQSPITGETVYMFEALVEKKYTFVGQIKLVDEPYTEEQFGEHGKLRKVWMFPLGLKGGALKPVWNDGDYRGLREKQQKNARKLTDEELSTRARASKSNPGKKTISSTQYYRDQSVVEYVKRKAGGNCDLCGKGAPFNNRGGEAYLECHHITWLSKGGADSIDNAAALCPNCHRKMHVLNPKADREKLLRRVEERDDND